MRTRFFLGLVLLLVTSNATVAQTTVFTYQGKLADNGNPAPNGNYDFQFSLFDALSGGAQQGTTQTAANILVTNGIFAVTLDFVNCSGCNCPTCFNGAARFLAIAVKPTGAGSFTPLTPRQPITSTPYAVKSVSSATADGLSVACVSCVTSSQIASVTGSAVTGSIPVASVPSGSTSYIQNTTSLQSSSNFNISGNGTADVFNAATQFNIGGNRILSSGGNENFFAGQGAGNVNTGSNNAFFGRDAGRFNTSGSSNSFFGAGAGFNNDDGGNNAFFGAGAGGNSFGGLTNANTFIGASAGAGNIGGRSNTMIGSQADAPFPSTLINATAIGSRAFVTQNNSLVLGSINGVNNATSDTNVGIGTTAPSQRLHVVGNGLFTGTLSAATVNINGFLSIGGLRALSVNGPYNDGTTIYAASNTFAGDGAGLNTTPTDPAIFSGNFNSFFGAGAGKANTTGFYNSFFGTGAGEKNTGGVSNSFFGGFAGSKNTIGDANSFFGHGAGQNNINGVANSFFGEFAGAANSSGSNNSSFGVNAGNANATGGNNSFFGVNAGTEAFGGSNNSFFGVSANFAGPVGNSTGSDNTLLGYSSSVTENLSNQTAIGSRAAVTHSDSLVLGSINGINGATADTRVGIGTTSPGYKLEIVDPGSSGLRVVTNTTGGTVASFGANGDFGIDKPFIDGGRFVVKESGNVGISVQIPQDKLDINGFVRLRTLASGNFTTLCVNSSQQISNCSSSIRYKTNVTKLSSSLTLINQLHPVTFNWKANNQPDLGLIAEEVAKVEPLLTFRNDKGEIEGVNYYRIAVVLLNAVKEQQAQIAAQQSQIENQQRIIETQKQLFAKKAEQIQGQQQQFIRRQQQQIDALKKLVCSSRRKAKACQ